MAHCMENYEPSALFISRETGPGVASRGRPKRSALWPFPFGKGLQETGEVLFTWYWWFVSFAGFHLSGEIRPPKTPVPQGLLDIERKYKVSVSFDRWEPSRQPLFDYRPYKRSTCLNIINIWHTRIMFYKKQLIRNICHFDRKLGNMPYPTWPS